MPRDSNSGAFALGLAGLVVLTSIAYAPAFTASFVQYDDGIYVTDNRHVQGGLTMENVRWAFTTRASASWQPLTWLSHMLDIELFGLAPAGHHAHNVLLHVVNTLLLALSLRKLTGAANPSLFVAGIFALHPFHVESVAWIAERKDVLSCLFWMLGIWVYAGYGRRPRWTSYSALSLCLALGLMAKPMLVTFPCVLLLLDWWPLQRLPMNGGVRARLWRLVVLVMEKLPLLGMAVAISVVTVASQDQTRSVISLEKLPLAVRASNAVVSYIQYIAKTVWPSGLAVHYPHPGDSLPPSTVAVCAVILLVASIFAVWQIKRLPYIAVGWFWYVGTLVPVIGIVQVGLQGMADRYSYVPMVGLLIAFAWGMRDILESISSDPNRQRRVSSAMLGASMALFVVLSWRTSIQAATWTNTTTLFSRALAVTRDNDLAHMGLALVLIEQGRYAEAKPHLEEALRINYEKPDAHYHLGLVEEKLGRIESAVGYYREAIRLDPGYHQAYNNLGLCQLRQGLNEEALQSFAMALNIQPFSVEAQGNYGAALHQLGRHQEAEDYLRKAIAAFPNAPSLYNNLGIALAAQGRLNEAESEFKKALHLDPDDEQTKANLQAIGVAPGP